MRKAKIGKEQNATIGTMQRYHQGGYGTENYAYMGFKQNKYFTSDRFTLLDDNYKRVDGKPVKGFGLEVENCWRYNNDPHDSVAKNIVANIVANSVYPLFPADLFKMQDDCTITGVEIISQIMTKEFIRNNYSSFKAMWNQVFPNMGITTNSEMCGMHVNISIGLFGTTPEKQEDNIRKLYYIINKFYDFFKIALYRTGDDTTWCGRMRYDNAKTMNVHNMSDSHHNCFNGSHYDAGRIEIRLVGGQKDFACFRNTMEVVFHIVDAVKVLKWSDLDDLAKIFKGCNNYVYNRISTNCYRSGVISQATLDAIKPTVTEVQYL